ncbi:hypothetical protein GSI_00360 [Ganoderma sinense ZZ0214-1]|uniref:Uncharacterized protein n=1 Tax=Ganoderma sinense ZZ0214-1 TaxID=1077348 RepID=A0A2G8SSB1_9APHY|nr:hypothetical protein GSI_00360 [Ganoderma sinense ZZ0214-1]
MFTDAYTAHVEGPSSNSDSEPAQPRIRPVRRFAAVPDDADVSSFELDIPVVGVDYDDDELLAAGISTELSRSKLALLVSNLFGALRRTFLEPTATLGRLGGFKLGVQMPK